MQLPFWHVSPVVQALPSLQAVPFVLIGSVQTPAEQTPATWHWSEAVQVFPVPPVQAPFWQVSPDVQVLPSSQAVPFVMFGSLHAPVAGLHVPAVWHWLLAVHTTGLAP